MADNRYGERGSSWNDRERGRSDADRARPGWGSLENRPDRGRDHDDDRASSGFFERAGEQVRSWFGDDDDRSDRDRSRRNFDHGASGVRGGEQRSHAQSWGEANRGDNWRGSSQQRESGSGGQGDWRGQSGQNFGYNDMSGMMGGFGNQRFGSGQDDHYLSWRNRQLEQLDRDYQDYCREREQQFHQDFDSWRSGRQASQSGQSGEQWSGGGTVASGQGESTDAMTSTSPTGGASGSFIGGGSDPSAATAGGGGDPTPEPMAPTGRGSRSRS